MPDEPKLRITEETYVVEEKLPEYEYSVPVNTIRLMERAKEMRDAGIAMQFYAFIRQLGEQEYKAFERRFGTFSEALGYSLLTGESLKEAENIDGIYPLTNLKTEGGKLKVVQEIREGVKGATKTREIDEDWQIMLDPVTADVLGLSKGPLPKSLERVKEKPARDILEKMNQTRHQMGISQENIKFLLEEKKGKI